MVDANAPSMEYFWIPGPLGQTDQGGKHPDRTHLLRDPPDVDRCLPRWVLGVRPPTPTPPGGEPGGSASGTREPSVIRVRNG